MKDKSFTIKEEDGIIIINNRLPFNLKNIIVIELSLFFFIYFSTSLLIALYISLLSIIGYIIFRGLASIYYTEIHVNKANKKLFILKKLFSSIRSKNIITNKLSLNNFNFIEINRSGKTTFILNYKTHKDNELLVFNNKNDKAILQDFLKEK